MAIFSRRTIQRLINENASFLTGKQTKTHVDKLNNGDLGAEWEVVLLNVFSKLGNVRHERNFNGRKPDIYFTSADHALDFVADIKTVSDIGTDQKNPQKQLAERLGKEIIKRDIKGGWKYEIGGNVDEARKTNSMIQLKLPPLGKFDKEIFNESWEQFTSQIKREPDKERKYEIKTERTDLSISYVPNKKWVTMGSSFSYKSITAKEHLIQNSIWNGLELKNDQLKNSGYEGALGIILCDGDSEYLPKSRDIIQEFLDTHPRINFVLTFEAIQNVGFERSNKIKIHFEKGKELGAELKGFLSNLHTHAERIFPYPIQSATNAIHALESTKRHRGSSFYGGLTASANKIKLSSRTILDLLAGRITYENFPESYKHFIQGELNEGRLIRAVEIEKDGQEKDDDWMVFRFGAPDPAITAYTVPTTKKS